MTEPHGEPEKSMKVCGAKNRQGKPCQRAPMANGRCSNHGGKTPKGIASPHFKHGRYSDHLPGQLRTMAEQAAADPELFNLTNLIAVYSARIMEALGRVGTDNTPERLWKIQQAWGKFQLALSLGNSPTAKARLLEAEKELDELIKGAPDDYNNWREIDTAAQNLKKLMESERKRQIEAHSLIPVVTANNFAREVMLLARREISDPAVWARFQAGMTELVGANPAIANSVE